MEPVGPYDGMHVEYESGEARMTQSSWPGGRTATFLLETEMAGSETVVSLRF